MNMEELKNELAHLKVMNRELYQTNIEPGISGMITEFLDGFEEYFRERGFVIRKKNNSVRVSFDTLHFKAFSNEGQEIFVMKGREQIASITVKFSGADQTNIPSFSGESLTQLEREIEKEKAFANKLKNPEFYYTGSEFGYKYETPMSVLESIFGE